MYLFCNLLTVPAPCCISIRLVRLAVFSLQVFSVQLGSIDSQQCRQIVHTPWHCNLDADSPNQHILFAMTASTSALLLWVGSLLSIYDCRELVTACSSKIRVSASLLIGFLGSDLHQVEAALNMRMRLLSF